MREGFGLVVIEANACGMPVITIDYKCNAAKDLVKEGKNCFVCRLDEKEITKNIMKANETPRSRATRYLFTSKAS